MDDARRACVFLSIDGTLCREAHPPSLQDLEGLRQLHANGHRFFLCTARSLPYIPSSLIELEPDGVISASSNHIIVENQIIYAEFVPYLVLHQLVADLTAQQFPLALSTPDLIYSLNGYPLPNIDHIALGNFKAFKRLGQDIQVSKLSFCATSALQKSIFTRLTSVFELIVSPNGFWEATLGGSSKGLGIKLVMDHLNISLANSYAIGVSSRDISMFNSTETGIAMGDAPSDVQQAADYVTASVENSGVYHALKQFQLID